MKETFYLLIFVIGIFTLLPALCEVFPKAAKLAVNRKVNPKVQFSFLTSLLSFIPVPGRIITVASILRSFINTPDNPKGIFKFSTKEETKNAGILSFIWSHHFYIWSTAEKTVLLPMTFFGISYFEFMKHMIFPLIFYLIAAVAATVILIPNRVEILDEKLEEKIFLTGKEITIFVGFAISVLFLLVLGKQGFLISGILCLLLSLTFSGLDLEYFKRVDFKSMTLVLSVIIIGFIVREYVDVKSVVQSNQFPLYLAFIVNFFIALILGSSSRFALSSVLFASMFGVKYLYAFLTIDFAGYLLSPLHKCTIIPTSIFGSSYKKFLFTSLILGLSSIIGMIISYVILGG